MARNSPHLFSSESVTEGHPDKIADQISDAVLDAMVEQDPGARVACEALVTTGMALVAGEVTADAWVEIPELVREVIREIGYVDSSYGFDAGSCAVLTSLGKQSPDISQGVDTGGAGDQGMMFGYATDETRSLMPLPITLAHGITRRLSQLRQAGGVDWLRPDGKSQVTVEYREGRPVAVRTVVISAQHAPDVGEEEIRETLVGRAAEPVIDEAGYETEGITYHVNPTGRFVRGGPQGDAGMTGRKIIVDTYGGVGSHGGGAFSGKDPSKVDRSASYAARWAAKNVVAAGLAREVEIQISYAIGVAEPISVMTDSKGTGEIADEELTEVVRRVFDLRPAAIIDRLGLRRPLYRRTAAYGHFGRQVEEDGGFSWERTDRTDDLKDAVG